MSGSDTAPRFQGALSTSLYANQPSHKKQFIVMSEKQTIPRLLRSDGKMKDVTVMNMSWDWTAGEVISNLNDLKT